MEKGPKWFTQGSYEFPSICFVTLLWLIVGDLIKWNWGINQKNNRQIITLQIWGKNQKKMQNDTPLQLSTEEYETEALSGFSWSLKMNLSRKIFGREKIWIPKSLDGKIFGLAFCPNIFASKLFGNKCTTYSRALFTELNYLFSFKSYGLRKYMGCRKNIGIWP